MNPVYRRKKYPIWFKVLILIGFILAIIILVREFREPAQSSRLSNKVMLIVNEKALPVVNARIDPYATTYSCRFTADVMNLEDAIYIKQILSQDLSIDELNHLKVFIYLKGDNGKSELLLWEDIPNAVRVKVDSEM